MLQALGLGRNEEAVYTALLSRPTASSQELVRQTGLGESEVDRVLLDLSERGLVVVAAEGDDRLPDPSDSGSPRPSARYRLTPPSVALAPLLVEQRNALHRAEAAFTMLTEQYRSTAAHPAGSVVEVVVGREQVAHRFHQLQRGAQRELLMFLVGEPSAVAREDADVSESSALDRGVDFRVVATKDYLDGPGVGRDVREGISAGLEIRLAESLP
ncbi:TrmB family transcriptional regulator [Streptomyces sp. NPDC056399]|uniref:TrmB family transcriptional regulator n=1 Tax=Streptomyces sp. NPDC056399 TaxID=3345807 RepID=UPI0035D5446F